MELDDIRARVTSVVTDDPFRFVLSESVFDFDRQPAGGVDRAVRLEVESAEIVGGFNYSEERTDSVHVWVARKHTDDTEGTYRSLVDDAASIRAAVIRDAHEDSGEYVVPDEGAGMHIERDPGASYAVLRVTVPVNYMTTV